MESHHPSRDFLKRQENHQTDQNPKHLQQPKETHSICQQKLVICSVKHLELDLIAFVQEVLKDQETACIDFHIKVANPSLLRVQFWHRGISDGKTTKTLPICIYVLVPNPKVQETHQGR